MPLRVRLVDYYFYLIILIHNVPGLRYTCNLIIEKYPEYANRSNHILKIRFLADIQLFIMVITVIEAILSLVVF